MKSVLSLIALLLVFSPLNAAADTFTLWDYFPDSQGDNELYGLYAGAWNTNPPENTSPYRELVHVGPDNNGSFAYTSDGINSDPLVPPMVKRVDYPWVFMQPSASEYAILSGNPDHPEFINISGQFQYVGGGEVLVSIGTITGTDPIPLQDWTLVDVHHPTIPFNFFNIPVSPDNSLYFAVNVNGNATNDGTLLSGSITTVPAPGALLLLGSGLLGLVGWRQSRKS